MLGERRGDAVMSGKSIARWITMARLFGVLLLAVASLPAAIPASQQQKRQSARAQFDKAEAARATLEAKPIADRRLSDYQAILKMYHSVLVLSPMVHQAPDSLFQAASLNEEMAKRFPSDAGKYRAEARNLYQTLLREYPQNRYRKQSNQAIAIMEAEDEEHPASAAPVVPVTRTAPAATEERAPGKLVGISNIREWTTPNYTRVVIDVDDEVKFEAGRIANPDRIYFDLHNTKLAPALKDRNKDVDDGLLKKVRTGTNKQTGTTRVVLEVGPVATYSAFLLPNPYRLVIDIQGGSHTNSASASNTPPAPTPPPLSAKLDPVPVRATAKPEAKPETKKDKKLKPADLPVESQAEQPLESKPIEAIPATSPDSVPEAEIPSTKGPTTEPVYAKVSPELVPSPTKSRVVDATSEPRSITAPLPNASGQRSLTRALGLKIGRVVIDAGHGGHDTGTIGPTGYTEKELVLDVALRLGQMVQERLGSEVVYTRDDDTFVPLEMRTAVANQKQADLFVSIHANASRDAKARGIETYYLSFSTSQDALETAARENAVSEKSVHELQDLVKKITLYEKVEESKEFAAEVQKSLYTGMSRGNAGLRNRGVRKAPFVVLIGANMPSILAEISFVSNPQDEKLLKKPEYRQRIAESLFHGIQRYASSLGGVKVASQRAEVPVQ